MAHPLGKFLDPSLPIMPATRPRLLDQIPPKSYCYRLQTKFAKVMFSQASVILSTGKGVCIRGWGSASRKGLHPGGICIPGGLHLGGLQRGGGLPLEGSASRGGVLGRPPGALQDTVNKRAVRIILECILAHIRIFVALLKRSVNGTFITTTSQKMNQLTLWAATRNN